MIEENHLVSIVKFLSGISLAVILLVFSVHRKTSVRNISKNPL